MAIEPLRPALAQIFAATQLRPDPDTDFALIRLPPAAYSELLLALAPLHDPRFQATVRARDEVTLIAPRDLWGRLGGRFPAATVDAPWRLITLDVSIPLDVYGYLEQIARLCAEQGSSVVVVSGYSTDHLLVPVRHYGAVLAALGTFIGECRAAHPA